MKGLIIKPYWADLILNGEKTLEIRGSKTKVRGRIYIIKSGTKKIYGEVDLVDCIELTEDNYYKLSNEHKVGVRMENIPYKRIYGWKLENPLVYKEPKDYNHKKGCVIWVNVD